MSTAGFSASNHRPFLLLQSSVAAEQLTCVCFTAHDEKPEAVPVFVLQCLQKQTEGAVRA